MTKAGKGAKLIFSIALIVLAFFCAFHATSSYFTAAAKEEGTINFSNVDVRFVYKKGGKGTQYPTDNETNSAYSISLFPTSGSIARGSEFELSDAKDGEAIDYITIKKMPKSADAYVRFWIDAYVYDSATQKVDTSVNYGKYFFFKIDEAFKDDVLRGACGYAGATEGDWCYYFADPFEAGSFEFTNTLIFKDIQNGDEVDEIPPEVLGEQLKITMTIEAVQVKHDAFRSEFADKKGYCSIWG